MGFAIFGRGHEIDPGQASRNLSDLLRLLLWFQRVWELNIQFSQLCKSVPSTVKKNSTGCLG